VTEVIAPICSDIIFEPKDKGRGEIYICSETSPDLAQTAWNWTGEKQWTDVARSVGHQEFMTARAWAVPRIPGRVTWTCFLNALDFVRRTGTPTGIRREERRRTVSRETCWPLDDRIAAIFMTPLPALSILMMRSVSTLTTGRPSTFSRRSFSRALIPYIAKRA
jgi:hypothetical protein